MAGPRRRRIDTLRAGLKQKWRNTLNKSERQELVVEIDEAGNHGWQWITARYAEDKKARDYPGPEPAFLTALGRTFAADRKLPGPDRETG